MQFNKGDLVRFKTTGRVGIVMSNNVAGQSAYPCLVRIIETGEDGYVYLSTLSLLSAKE